MKDHFLVCLFIGWIAYVFTDDYWFALATCLGLFAVPYLVTKDKE